MTLFLFFSKSFLGTSEKMAQQVRVLGAKPDSLTHKVEGENCLPHGGRDRHTHPSFSAPHDTGSSLSSPFKGTGLPLALLVSFAWFHLLSPVP